MSGNYKNPNYMKEYLKVYRESHKEIDKKYQAIYRIKNKEKSKDYIKKYNQENKDKVSGYKIKHYSENKNTILRNRRIYYEENKEVIKKNRKINLIVVKAYNARRRIWKSDFKTSIVQLVYEDNIKKYGTLTCYLCLKQIEFGKDHLEHKTPLSRGGTNEYNNLAVACQKCNCRKNKKTEE